VAAYKSLPHLACHQPYFIPVLYIPFLVWCIEANGITFRLYNMSVPPSFSDLGKAARDIFSKGYSKYQMKVCTFVRYKVAVV